MIRHHLDNIYRLGVKELWSLWRDPMMLFLIIYTFTLAIYVAGTAMPENLHNAAIAIVDEDASALSTRITSAFYPPQFNPPQRIELNEVDAVMDSGRYTFVLVIPPNFQRDVLAGKAPKLQLNIDATRMSQSFTGNGHIQQIVLGEINEFVQRHRAPASLPVELVMRARFNPSLTPMWFGSLMEVVNSVTLLSVILAGAALIREREHGTIEHLLVMPLTPFEIMMAKIWANGLAVLIGVTFALLVMVQQVLKVPIAGSLPLFLAAAACYLFAAASIGIFLGTLSRSMPQFGLLVILSIIPLLMLSGGVSPRESMPQLVQNIMLAAPTTYFVRLAQAILYRGAGFDVIWRDLLAMTGVGACFFTVALLRFRRAVTQTQV